ncbi:MAG: MBL fold metallo-hydrolase [Lachnospiraceae bacterium]|nr:MBL fold metallo-hydrolase [Lachnospiraceae bacterium]
MTDNIGLMHFVVGPVSTNCYIVYNRQTLEAFVVDPGANASGLVAKLQEKNLKPVAILLTHGHFDHAGAAEELADKYDIPIYAHEAEAETLNNPSINLSGNMMGQPARYEVDNFLRDEETIKLAGFDIRVLFTPGHTPGGCCYYLPYEDLLFSGDTLFCGSVGRTDFPGGSMSQLVGAVRDKLMVLPDNTVVLTGHDSDTTIERERLYNPYL